MAKRQRKVYDDRMVAHVWANQSQEEARNSRGTFYFEDQTIYSYGAHFPIAKFVTNKKGQRAVLFTTDTYGPTTAKHINFVHGALRGLDVPVFNVSRLDIDAAFAKEQYLRRTDEMLTKASKARLYAESYMNRAREVAQEANAYAKFFGYRWKLKVPEFGPEALAEIRANLKAHEAKQEKLRAAERVEQERRRIEQVEKEAEQRVEWLAGVNNSYHSSYRYSQNEETLLRVHDDEVQTSRGAVVPVDHARKVWPHILKCQAEGREFVANGRTIKVGEFAIDRIEVNGDIKAGCHFIKFDQIHKIAQQLGLIQEIAHGHAA